MRPSRRCSWSWWLLRLSFWVLALYPSMPRSAQAYTTIDHRAGLEAMGPLLGRLALEPARSEEVLPVPERMELESRIVAMEREGVGSTDRLGPQSGLTCPECHGALTRIEQDRFLRFRCHEGHAYTARAMAAEQNEVSEHGLWNLIRLIEERVALHTQMADWSHHQNGDEESAARWESEVERLRKDADKLRRILTAREGVRAVPNVPA